MTHEVTATAFVDQDTEVRSCLTPLNVVSLLCTVFVVRQCPEAMGGTDVAGWPQLASWFHAGVVALDLAEVEQELATDGPEGAFILRDIEAAPECFGIEYKLASGEVTGALIEVRGVARLGSAPLRLSPSVGRPNPMAALAESEGWSPKTRSFKRSGSFSRTTRGKATRSLA